jgi:hypothetical protein
MSNFDWKNENEDEPGFLKIDWEILNQQMINTKL